MAQMPGGATALTPCVEGSDEHLMFVGLMEELESLCNMQFACFQVLGYTKQVVNGVMFQVKIKVAESGDTPVVHVKFLQENPHLPKGPEINWFKKDQTEDADFNFEDGDQVMRAMGMGMGFVEQPEIVQPANEEMKDESQPTTTDAELAAAAVEGVPDDQEVPQGQPISGMVNQ